MGGEGGLLLYYLLPTIEKDMSICCLSNRLYHQLHEKKLFKSTLHPRCSTFAKLYQGG